MDTLKPATPKSSTSNAIIAYIITMMIAVVLLSLLTYVGPPFGPDWATIRDYFSGMLP